MLTKPGGGIRPIPELSISMESLEKLAMVKTNAPSMLDKFGTPGNTKILTGREKSSMFTGANTEHMIFTDRKKADRGVSLGSEVNTGYGLQNKMGFGLVNENIGSIYIKLPLLKNLPVLIEPFNKDFTITLMNEEIEVPSLSPIAMKVILVAFQEDVSVNQLTDIVKIDPLLTTKILKVVNSSIFSHKQKITTLTRAVSILGMNIIKNIALCISILESFPFTNIGGFDYRKFWELSLCSALICRFTAREFNRKLEEEAFMAGLLQNIGSLVLAKHFPFKYSEIIESYFHKNYDITELEINEWGIDHLNMGNMLLKKWNFPDIFTNVVLYHHNPEKIPENISYVSDIAWLVNLSDKVVKFLDSGNSKYIEDAKENYLTRFNIKSKQLDKIIAYVSSNVGIIAKDFNLNIEYDVNYTEMLLRANVQLGKITLSLEQANRELKKVITEKIELTEKLKSANEKLAHQAVTDGLTGIFNHRFFYEVLNKRFSEARRHNYPLSCIMADIDYFKIFNDTFGHRAGDEVLLKVATIIKNTVRNEDIVARYGGEEFIILLPETDKEKAKIVAERIRENIENEKFLNKLSKGEVTISFGVATYTKEKNWTSPNSLVKESDKALYLAKRNGRNRVEIV
jgi:diguanylate cyclase (GGDEF)-like protein